MPYGIAPMHVLLISPLWPYPEHSVRAANVVTHQMLLGLAAHRDLRISFMRVSYNSALPSENELAGLRTLREHGVSILEPLELPRVSGRRSRNPMDAMTFYPEIAHRPLLNQRVSREKVDVVVVPWSEWLTALAADVPAKRFAYYGNPDPKVLRARSMLEAKFGGNRAHAIRGLIKARFLDIVHDHVMHSYDWLGNVAANDAAYYRNRGHPNAFYIRNMWIDRMDGQWMEERARRERQGIGHIAGNLGKLTGTANSYGLALLTPRYAEALQIEARGPYQIHLYGAGSPYPRLAVRLSDRSEIAVRGFVENIDRELLQTNVFLCLNNASPFKVCHTRYLHAWSLGGCVVAHRDAALSLAEMSHGENALLGDSIEDCARLTAEALDNPQLRLTLGSNGYETFRQHFLPAQVANDLVSHLAAPGI